MEEGWFKLHRKFFKNQFWKEERQYSKAEAWLDLLQSAKIDASSESIKGVVIEVQRGQLVASRRYLEKRWKWGSTKVTNFLKQLQKKSMINLSQTNGQTVITLVKYEYYNSSQTNNRTRGKPEANQNKRIKERKEVFKKQVFKYSAECDSATLLDFFNYWSEHGERDRKMRYEKEKSFDLKRRLDRWLKNQKNWNKEKSSAKKESAAELLHKKHGIKQQL